MRTRGKRVTAEAVVPRDVLVQHMRVEPRSLHYHALGPGLLSGIPRWVAGRRTVVTVHGLDWQREKWGCVARGPAGE